MIKCLVNSMRNIIAFSTKVSAKIYVKATSASKISYGLIEARKIIFLPEGSY